WIGDWDGVFHFDGIAWRRVPELEFASVHAVAARARDDVWVAAAKAGVAAMHHFDGASWTNTLQMSIDAGTIYGTDARAPDDAWAVGVRTGDDLPNRSAGFLLHWDGLAWSRVPDAPTGLWAVLSTPGYDVAVGDGGRVLQLAAGAGARAPAF